MKPIHKKIVFIVAIAACIGIAIIVAVFFRAARILLEAERRSWATTNTCILIEKFISQTSQWPTSWDDLESITHHNVEPHWPEDRAYFEANVLIDFNATLEEISMMTPDTFTAVSVNGPNTLFHDMQFPLLIDTAQTTLKNSD